MSDVENNLSVDSEALAEESPERLQLQGVVRNLCKEYQVLSLQLQKRPEKLIKLLQEILEKVQTKKREK